MSQYEIPLNEMVEIWNLIPDRDQDSRIEEEYSPDVLKQTPREMVESLFELRPTDEEVQEVYEQCKIDSDGCLYLGTLKSGAHVFQWDNGEIIVVDEE